jgi:hypothetical protein
MAEGMDVCCLCHTLRPYWSFSTPGGACAECSGKSFTVFEVLAILQRDREQRQQRDTRTREWEQR